MKNTFTICGKTITAKPFNVNMVCDLEELGVHMEDYGKNKLSLIRAYLAICENTSIEDAGKMIEKSLINGEDISNIVESIDKELEKSDFFQAMFKTQEEATTESQTEETSKGKA